MKLIPNIGSDRVLDLLQKSFQGGDRLDLATSSFSLFAFAELRDRLQKIESCRVVLPESEGSNLALQGSAVDRHYRNRLQSAWLARICREWLEKQADVRELSNQLPQSFIRVSGKQPEQDVAILGNCQFSTDGLGITPGNQFGIVQAMDQTGEVEVYAKWFDGLWNSCAVNGEAKQRLLDQLKTLYEPKSPAQVFYQILYQIFKSLGQEFDEERIVKSATGIRKTQVWQKLYKFQRDGVVGAIDKLERFGGCIIADSVGLGKTFEALAVIKYHELRNDRVLVLVPKRLRDNWTLYKSNDRRNILAADRFNYDVLNHTDLSRDGGLSGDIDLSHVVWGNYDLVVIDESHNFRNKKTPRAGGETRYDRLMRRIIKEGVKTRVLMLSATPVNNRLADLRNQIAFATEGDDTALMEHGIESIERTTQFAQKQFNKWLALDEADRHPTKLLDMLGFDYFQLLDLLTIARSRKHIEKYYGTGETGRFPERLQPKNIYAEVDQQGEFRSIKDINTEIRRLKLAAYAPLRYVLPHKQEAYDKKYSTQLSRGEGYFRQVDREESLIHLLRINVLKRMESAVPSFALTLQRQLADVEGTLAHIESREGEIEELDIADIDLDDPTVENLLVGRKVKVLLTDVDLVRWKQDLVEDRNRLSTLYSAAQQIVPKRDAKLEELRKLIAEKCAKPINPGNRKIIVFTAFADTAKYLYDQLSTWALEKLDIHSALVTGAGRNQTTLPDLRKDLGTILTAFSPRSKERPEDLADEGQIDLLIATDCISEGQNLQDCDFLVNYDIHWNPVRIIQRFGRIDRIGSPNTRIQLVNFWPNIQLEEYIKLEQRVSGRMVLLDISATGEENLIEADTSNRMNDLEYRRNQLLKLQDAVIDLEDLSSGVSIADLTFTDYRIELGEYLNQHQQALDALPLGLMAVTTNAVEKLDVPPGVIFCLRRR
ncbi:MAG: helicase-related protein [Pirellulales bacterium]